MCDRAVAESMVPFVLLTLLQDGPHPVAAKNPEHAYSLINTANILRSADSSDELLYVF